jgi:hypothetical protein
VGWMRSSQSGDDVLRPAWYNAVTPRRERQGDRMTTCRIRDSFAATSGWASGERAYCAGAERTIHLFIFCHLPMSLGSKLTWDLNPLQ